MSKKWHEFKVEVYDKKESDAIPGDPEYEETKLKIDLFHIRSFLLDNEKQTVLYMDNGERHVVLTPYAEVDKIMIVAGVIEAPIPVNEDVITTPWGVYHIKHCKSGRCKLLCSNGGENMKSPDAAFIRPPENCPANLSQDLKVVDGVNL